MTWQPVTTVTIAGEDYTGETVGNVTVTRGRKDVYSEPVAGYAVVNLIDTDGTGIPIDLAAQLRIAVQDSNASDVSIFTGLITDVDRALYDPGLTNQPASITTVTAIGPLARMSRRQAFADGRPPEKDADRVLAAILQGLGTSWEEARGTWADQPAGLEWGDYDPIDESLVAGGLFDLGALTAQEGGQSTYDVATFASFSSEGILYETGTGQVAWENADSRSDDVNYTVIEGNLIRAEGLTTNSSLSEIVNRLELVYDGGAVQSDEPESIILFGRYDRRIETSLANLSNAEARAERFLDRHAFPLTNLDAVTIRLDGLDDPDADALLAVDINTPVVLTDLPATLDFSQLPGFVEGLRINLDPFRYEVTLSISDAELSIGAIRFTQVPATTAWNQVPANLAWQDARRL